MEKIPSFTKNHDKLAQGLHECGTANGVTTWDLRFKKPNAGDFLSPESAHTIEHVLATLLRNSARRADIVYFGPMGCLTGFYLLTVNMNYAEVLSLLKECFALALNIEEIPGNKREECGNYLFHDLDLAKDECKKYLEILKRL